MNLALIRILVLLILGSVEVVAADEPTAIIRQKDVAPESCAPTAFANALLNSSAGNAEIFRTAFAGDTDAERTKSMISSYLETPSITFRAEKEIPKFSTKIGMNGHDLIAGIEAMRSDGIRIPKMESHHLIRMSPEENTTDHLRRVYDLLVTANNGAPVVLLISQVEAKFFEDEDKFLFSPAGGHFVTVTRVQPDLGEDATGFVFSYLDPSSGEVAEAYAHVSHRRFYERKWNGGWSLDFLGKVHGVETDKERSSNWTTRELERPFIVLAAPKLGLRIGNIHHRQVHSAKSVILPVRE